MPRPDDNGSQELVDITIKAASLTAKTITDTIKWYIENGKDESKFKINNGQVDMQTLHEKAGTVKFLPHEMDLQEVQTISKEFEKYNVLFAVDKQENGKFVLAFAGQNEQSIEYAMQKIVEKQDKQISKSRGDKSKSRMQDIKDRYAEHANEQKGERERKEREHDRQKSRPDMEL